jgi:hypothetical protein
VCALAARQHAWRLPPAAFLVSPPTLAHSIVPLCVAAGGSTPRGRAANIGAFLNRTQDLFSSVEEFLGQDLGGEHRHQGCLSCCWCASAFALLWKAWS